MTTFFSPATGFFYDDNVNSFIPSDARKVSDQIHNTLLAGQSGGRRIISDMNGSPILSDPPPPDLGVLGTIERQWRDERLAATDGVVSRHRDELEEGVVTTLTTDQYIELQAYRRALRDWPQGSDFPSVEHRPPTPALMASIIP
ncbi:MULTISPECIES: phage tail assembly chaperone [Pseudomonas]|uniref:Phage tail assembly chaperone n=1 Tax=Pseudomonas carassii TaxID=3115855 RepID=A0ABU7HB01_9PSED|nr:MULTISPECIES: phage tail assembly chaperone [Pseudomonas]MDH1655140.1 phage tail assembly chaperone [Pseudomonas mosselii]MDH1717511.1 phage tail assembly chaperone [Pseudomonas mosselii]MDH1721863.1 phage tail assembly chaperone [Pseudomonas mosselii]MEE1888491.1 phage tail assembly chaperone [Pseudomonas sp. 137P]